MSAIGQSASFQGWAGAVWRASYRYGLSSLGPVAVSAAHFLASVLFLRLLRPEEFGQFAFLLIVVPFCLGASGALLGAPASLTRGKDEATARAEIFTLQKTSLIVSLLAITGLCAAIVGNWRRGVALCAAALLLVSVYCFGGWLLVRSALNEVKPRYLESMEESLVDTSRLQASRWGKKMRPAVVGTYRLLRQDVAEDRGYGRLLVVDGHDHG